MTALVTSSKELIKYFDYTYFLKFLILFLGLYGFNYIYIGLLDDTGIMYSSFLSHKLNYIDWFRQGMLHITNFLTHTIGLNTYIDGVKHLRVINGPSVMLGRPCLGMGMMIFWIAFVNAHKAGTKERLWWTAGGLLSICIINVCRIALLLFALTDKWNINKFMNHHDMFNLFAYTLILGMVLLYNRYNSKENNQPSPSKIYNTPIQAE